MKQHTGYIKGMHCAACKILIEDIVINHPDVDTTIIEMHTAIIMIETQSDRPIGEIFQELQSDIIKHGYTLSSERFLSEKQKTNNFFALFFGIIILSVFFYLQKSGILNIGIGGGVTPISSFMIGLVASVSSCLAIVGGLVLSLSATVSQDNKSDTKNFILFHAGRIVGFGLLGGLLGILGESLGINPFFASFLGILAAIIMILLGLNLTGLLRASLTIPSGIFTRLKSIERKTLTPLIIGIGTFFLPCGFTQSMQFASLSSGSFSEGLLIMGAFSLGTFPMLALLSFGATGFSHSRFSGIFFRTSGVVVIGLGLFSLLTGLASLGVIPPLFNL